MAALLERRGAMSMIATVVLSGRAPAAGGSASSVLVIPSIHRLLAANPLYDYARLYALVAAFTPDLVGVEIRQEDLERPETYLKHNYPQEMIVLEGLYQDRVFGFDWLGDELKGRAVPDDWWTRQSHIKQLERTCSAASPATSPVAAALNARIAELSRQRENLLQTASAASLSEGPYDAVTTEYYRFGGSNDAWHSLRGGLAVVCKT